MATSWAPAINTRKPSPNRLLRFLDLLDDHQLTAENLKQYDAIVVGIRAYNVVERLKFRQPALMEYVHQGGTLIVQYNTNHSLVLPMEEPAPYPLKVSCDAVSASNGVRILAPDHEVLNWPNKITQKDLRLGIRSGLYFPNECNIRIHPDPFFQRPRRTCPRRRPPRR
ncbi:MAG: hypothetical protein R2788_21840 [Saprospiraceae bacterium]